MSDQEKAFTINGNLFGASIAAAIAAIGLAMISMPSITQELISWVIIVGVFLGLIYEYNVYSKTKN
jgi:hypothetical protein